MDDQLTQRIAKANRLALAARSAAEGGDQARAAELRKEFDRLYDELELEIEQADDPAGSLELTIAKANAVLAGLGTAGQ
jgi:hypothetical protein